MPYAIEIALVAAAAIAGGAAIYSGEQSRKATNSAADMAQQESEKQLAQTEKVAKAQEQATNRAQAKSADSSRILSAAQQAAKGGVSGTMLTGSTGVDPASLMLGMSSGAKLDSRKLARTSLLGS